ncbi:hypothetical protein HA466_0294480 [Hirschfeldia incana]|nr:hypothetical protein HA466_0294480 [Hirschfeldia incana]
MVIDSGKVTWTNRYRNKDPLGNLLKEETHENGNRPNQPSSLPSRTLHFKTFLNSSHKKFETDIISDQSSSVSESCDMRILPVLSTNCYDDSASSSAGHSRLPDLNISLIPAETVVSWPVCGLQESSSNGSTRQKTLLLFR